MDFVIKKYCFYLPELILKGSDCFFIPSCCVVVGLLCDGSVGCGWGCRGAPQHGQRGRGGGEYRYSIYICNFFPIRISFLSSVYTSLSLGAIPPPKKKNPESVPSSISWACCDDVYILSFPKISYELSEACNYISSVEIVDLAASCRYIVRYTLLSQIRSILA